MNIHWFPGHMTKALRQLEISLKTVDFVVYIVDSRAPWSCQNPAFDKLLSNFPVIYVLNKCDFGDLAICQKWINTKTQENIEVICTNSRKNNLNKLVVASINRVCRAKLDKFKSKNINVGLRGIVVGVPNVGKSTFINSIARSKKAKTGDVPGVTRGQQCIKINEYLELQDTPGTLYPKLNDENVAINLALIGSIRDQVLDITELSHRLIEKLQIYDCSILYNLCECSPTVTPSQVLSQFAAKRGFVLKGGLLDIDRAASGLIDEFRKGKLGKITLDSP